MTIVIDASALTEIILGTPVSDVLAPRLTRTRVLAPDIIDAEVASTLRRHHRQGDLTDRSLVAALDLLVDWPGVRVPTRLMVGLARRWWGNVSAYDALYLAVALASGASVLTCDARLSRAPGTGVPVENVRVI